MIRVPLHINATIVSACTTACKLAHVAVTTAADLVICFLRITFAVRDDLTCLPLLYSLESTGRASRDWSVPTHPAGCQMCNRLNCYPTQSDAYH